MTNIRNHTAAIIREVDGGNKMPAAELGAVLASRLIPFFHDLYAEDVIGFVERINPGKTMGAGALADAIVDHFHLEEN